MLRQMVQLRHMTGQAYGRGQSNKALGEETGHRREECGFAFQETQSLLVTPKASFPSSYTKERRPSSPISHTIICISLLFSMHAGVREVSGAATAPVGEPPSYGYNSAVSPDNLLAYQTPPPSIHKHTHTTHNASQPSLNLTWDTASSIPMCL